ncbi:DNRLRE domain-containing protein [Paenibacillus sp. FSL H3-0286]|uniref:DNRLRE domain-containing protein n=1 Tax=Paenibacillus sp. FSL H3-0286 TaxID=2921427 RepID=UPI00324F5B08
MDEINDISSTIIIKNRLSNRMQGSFTLFRPAEDFLDSSIIIMQHNGDDLRSTISVKVEKYVDVDSIIDIKYRGNSNTEAEIEAIAANYMNASIEVRPHNQMFGKFMLMEAPKVNVKLSPMADATTRSRDDLRTINYGDTRSMLTGKSPDEDFGAFIQFNDLYKAIPDLKYIESAKLRLYYATFIEGGNLELHQPNTIWRELGVTDANKPHSVELLNDKYSINTIERYIEFDVFDIAKRWQSGSLDNYGFIISTSDDSRYTFFTRESDKSPELIINYITSQVYSIGRSELESSIFIYGRGNSDLSAKLIVDSDIGIDNLESSLYVHRAADFLPNDLSAKIVGSKPDLFSKLTVQKRTFSDLESTITVGVRTMTEIISGIGVSNPDMDSVLTVDPNMSLASLITVYKPTLEYLDSSIVSNVPDLFSTITVSKYKKAENELESTLIVKSGEESNIDSIISVSRRDIEGSITIRVQEDTELSGYIQVPDRYDFDSILGYSHPDMASVLTVKYADFMDSQIYVKDKEYLDSIIDVKNITEMSGFLMVKAFDQIDGELAANNPDLFGTILPRVAGDNDLVSQMLIKKRNVSDLNSYISVRGQGNRNFVIIF